MTCRRDKSLPSRRPVFEISAMSSPPPSFFCAVLKGTDRRGFPLDADASGSDYGSNGPEREKVGFFSPEYDPHRAGVGENTVRVAAPPYSSSYRCNRKRRGDSPAWRVKNRVKYAGS